MPKICFLRIAWRWGWLGQSKFCFFAASPTSLFESRKTKIGAFLPSIWVPATCNTSWGDSSRSGNERRVSSQELDK